MLLRSVVVLAGVGGVLICAGSAGAATYTFVALPTVGSDTNAAGFAVNLVGGAPEVAGKSATTHLNWARMGNPVVWSGAGTGTNILPDISGAVTGAAAVVDTSGDVAGYGYKSNSVYEAYYLPSGGTSAAILPDLSSTIAGTYPGSMALGMNASGQVVGASVASDGNDHAAVWTNTGGSWAVTDLGANGYASWATCISANGVVAGQYTATSGTAYLNAAIWTYNKSAWTVQSLADTSYYLTGAGYACAISDNGQYVVGSSSFQHGVPMPVAWAVEFHPGVSGAGSITNLGNLGNGGELGNNSPPVYASDAALGVNDSGVIVGQSDTGSAMHAFIYGLGGNNTMQDMNTVFASSIPSGWYLYSATGIDDRGDIVGEAVNPSGTLEGFLLAATLPGDANLDGKVDINDLTIVLSHYGQTAPDGPRASSPAVARWTSTT